MGGKYNEQEERYKYEVEKDGEYEYIRSFRAGDILPNGKSLKGTPHIQVKHKYCGSVYTVNASGFINTGQRCGKCCQKYKNSFAYHIEVELGEPLEKYWDYEKNTVNPYFISKQTHIRIWLKCIKTDYHGSYETQGSQFVRGFGCSYCYGENTHPLDSFAQYHIDNTNKDFLEKYWDFNKNTVSPWEIKPSSNKKVWIKCQNEEVNEMNGLMKKEYHESYEVRCCDFTIGTRCNYCNPAGKNPKVHKFDSIGFTDPQLAKMIISDNFNKPINTYSISPNTSKKYYFKCKECGKVSSKPKELRKIRKNGYSCEYCSDGFHVTEKFMSNILSQINIKYIYQKSFKWAKITHENNKLNGKKYYDFYIPSLNIIIETHGMQHYKDSYRKTKELEIENDKIKKELALNNTKEYIEVDYRYSEFEWLKNNTIRSLSSYFDLSNIDWNLAWNNSQNSVVYEICDIYNKGIKSPKEIKQYVDVSESTITKYLKRGFESNICNYSKKDVREYVTRRKAVICISTKNMFTSIKNAREFYNIKSDSGIVLCCKGKISYSGKLPDGTKLVWRYLKADHNRKYRSNEMYKLHSKQIENIAA